MAQQRLSMLRLPTKPLNPAFRFRPATQGRLSPYEVVTGLQALTLLVQFGHTAAVKRTAFADLTRRVCELPGRNLAARQRLSVSHFQTEPQSMSLFSSTRLRNPQ